ncbi:MAG: hypothetical protein RBQ97_01430 [Acholeplasma sp.]|nr:hypothetical protein [Acholeplasma sp.]
MNKVIISLEGFENSGKSFVLNQVINMMVNDSNVTKIIRLKDYKDKTYIFEMNEKTILITTMGDDDKTLSDQLEFAQLVHPKGFNIIVYAKRSDKDFECILELSLKQGYSCLNPIKQVQMNVVKNVYSYKEQEKKVTTIDMDCLQADNKNALDLYALIKQHL